MFGAERSFSAHRAVLDAVRKARVIHAADRSPPRPGGARPPPPPGLSPSRRTAGNAALKLPRAAVASTGAATSGTGTWSRLPPSRGDVADEQCGDCGAAAVRTSGEARAARVETYADCVDATGLAAASPLRLAAIISAQTT
jgi:hypothetical protein